ncbi:glycine-rich protein 1-like isoform X2 [Triticum aestivum]|uniref:glycine-rich protein 1-like isoform X2 n=1 Tax=Triticum aestivum TaxID=4565 RepID=UPI001D0310E7|nr:glycine-rich protein 1-like isoform X2 [Triticum aestivum]
MAQGVAAGGGSSTTAGAGASTAADGDPGTADGGQGGAGDGSSVRSAAGGHGAAMQHFPMSSAAGAGHGDVAGGAGHGDAARLGVDAGLGHGAAADLEGEPPKKRTKTTKTAELSIVPCEDGVPTRMCFPPSKSLETTTKKRGKHANSSAGASKSKSLKNTNKKGKGGNLNRFDRRDQEPAQNIWSQFPLSFLRTAMKQMFL